VAGFAGRARSKSNGDLTQRRQDGKGKAKKSFKKEKAFCCSLPLGVFA
jgi:hypothetical protein